MRRVCPRVPMGAVQRRGSAVFVVLVAVVAGLILFFGPPSKGKVFVGGKGLWSFSFYKETSDWSIVSYSTIFLTGQLYGRNFVILWVCVHGILLIGQMCHKILLIGQMCHKIHLIGQMCHKIFLIG